MANFFSWIANGLMLEAMSAHKFFAYFVAILILVAIGYSLFKFIFWIVKKVQSKSNNNYYKKNRSR